MLWTVGGPPRVVACYEFVSDTWYLIWVWCKPSVLACAVLLGPSLPHRIVLAPLSITRLLFEAKLLQPSLLHFRIRILAEIL